MGQRKLTGSQAILGGAVILNAPTFYTNAGMTTSSTSAIRFYGTPEVELTTTDATLGGIKFGGATKYIKQLAFTGASFATAATNYDTTWDVPAESIITDVFIDITTIGTSGTLGVGLEGTLAGLMTGVGIQSVGPKRGSLVSGAVTYGTLMYDFTHPTCNINGMKVNHVTSGAISVFMTRSATTLTAAAVGNLYITYIVPE